MAPARLPGRALAPAAAAALAIALLPGAARAGEERKLLRLGVLLETGVPQPLGVELFARIDDTFGVGLGYQSLPQSFGDTILSIAGVSNAHLSSDAVDLDLRWFPFHGSFFLGASAGRQTLTASASQSGQQAQIDATTWFATPRLGYLFVFGNGISFGIDGGVQFPISTNSVITPAGGPGSSEARSAADLISSTPFPSVHLRLGYLF
jgi:hypothetical protein